MNENNVIEINAILKLVGAFRLSDNEIIKLDKAGYSPTDLEGYYSAANFILQERSATNPRAKVQSTELVKLAMYDGYELEIIIPDVAEVGIPIFGGGL